MKKATFLLLTFALLSIGAGCQVLAPNDRAPKIMSPLHLYSVHDRRTKHVEPYMLTEPYTFKK
jgi:hypothetical protein